MIKNIKQERSAWKDKVDMGVAHGERINKPSEWINEEQEMQSLLFYIERRVTLEFMGIARNYIYETKKGGLR